jgi:hypothetical protein
MMSNIPQPNAHLEMAPTFGSGSGSTADLRGITLSQGHHWPRLRQASADCMELAGPPIPFTSHAYSPLINDNLTQLYCLLPRPRQRRASPFLRPSSHHPSLIRRRILSIVLRYFEQYGDLYHATPKLRSQEPQSAFGGLSTSRLLGTGVEGEEDANEQAEDPERV